MKTYLNDEIKSFVESVVNQNKLEKSFILDLMPTFTKYSYTRSDMEYMMWEIADLYREEYRVKRTEKIFELRFEKKFSFSLSLNPNDLLIPSEADNE